MYEYAPSPLLLGWIISRVLFYFFTFCLLPMFQYSTRARYENKRKGKKKETNYGTLITDKQLLLIGAFISDKQH